MFRRLLVATIMAPVALALSFVAKGYYQAQTAPTNGQERIAQRPQSERAPLGAASFKKYEDVAAKIASLFPEDEPKKISYPDTKNQFVREILSSEFYRRVVPPAAGTPLANDPSASIQEFAVNVRHLFEGPDPVFGANAGTPSAPAASAATSSGEKGMSQAWYAGWLARLIANTSVVGNTPGGVDLARRGSYELLGIRKKTYDPADGEKIVATFRLILAGSRGVNYHDYIFKSITNDDARTTNLGGENAVATVVDVYDYQNGELLSEAFRRDFILTSWRGAQRGIRAGETGSLERSGERQILAEELHGWQLPAVSRYLSQTSAGYAGRPIVGDPIAAGGGKRGFQRILNRIRQAHGPASENPGT